MPSEPTRPIQIDETEKYIRVKIGKGGKIVVEAYNFNGQGCRAATERLEARLGSVTKRNDKDDGTAGACQTVRN
ncbi:MAG: DUF2997 domain-containing protein [Acidipila sp.]|nr:DUF2997 domain-containing protein [Acidipila sp.]